MTRRVVLLMLLVTGLVTTPVAAQLQTDFAFGLGFEFNQDEGASFRRDNVFAAIHWNGFKLPWLGDSTGLGVEFHPGSFAISEIDGEPLVNVDYRLWSLNRFDCPAALYCGTDLKIGEGGEGGWRNDFDQRIVMGIELGDVWKEGMSLNFEFYFLEDDRPISGMLVLRWGQASETKPPEGEP